MQPNVMVQEEVRFDVTPGEGAGPASRDQAARVRRSRPTSQAERAVMRPLAGAEFHDQYDPDWRYYHGALVD